MNAYDLVRLHKFGDQDDACDDKTPPNRLPSYQAMCQLAAADRKVSQLVTKERVDSAVSDFGKLTETQQEPEDLRWGPLSWN